MKIKFFILTLIILLLSACKQEPTAVVPTETNTPIATSTDAPTPTTPPTLAPESPTNSLFYERVSPDHVRLLNYNVNWDSIFQNDDPQNHEWRGAHKVNEFRRIITAVSPDIVCLQEINPARNSSQVSDIFDMVIPLENGEKWHAVIAGDNVIVSKFDLSTNGYSIYIPQGEDVFPQAAALIDLPDNLYGQTDLYLICSHFPAFGGQEAINSRQAYADMIIRQVGDLKTVGDYIDLPENTPFIFSGDFNAYNDDPRKHIDTLLTGDIVFEDRFGGDLLPDWDNTSLTDLLPSHHGEGTDFYTWRNDDSEHVPYQLDRIIYSDSVITISNSFILNTQSLSADILAELGLYADDVLINPDVGYFDHLPIVVDFSLLGD